MATDLLPMSILRRLWQKLFLRVEDAYRFPSQDPTSQACPVLCGNGVVEAIDIPSRASIGLPQGHRRSENRCHLNESCASGVAHTPSSVDSGFCITVSLTPPLQPVVESKRRPLCNGSCPTVVPFYSVNTDPLDVHIVLSDGCPGCGGSVEDVSAAGLDGVREATWSQRERVAGILWQRPLFTSAPDTTPEHTRLQCVMGVPIRLDPAVVCDLDTGPFDRSCYESVFYDTICDG